ncbi:ABC transporter permease [Rhodobacter sp. 24-YEA-8]|uniref:ABC transporter permease n=1 Tax=Rhodobacter sp. 24-YEA-8 TaxID=1884310 RepID=UPI0008995C00|nr:ABC transporter permease [Rhodobacter sp. 24-YEA-8]SED87118.1 peptide/nickel transport system permease protein [Rhodobacter sp. 24-YEA-8]
MHQIPLRLLSAIPTLFGVVLATFLLTRVLPGDPAVFFASNPSMTNADIEAVRQSLGLDQPLPQQFLTYLGAIARGDLGQSFSTGQPVLTELINRLPASAELTVMAFLLALAVAIPLGLAAALRPGSLVDHLSRIIATLGVSMPTFVTGLLLIYLFYFLLGVAPEPIGRLDPFMFEPDRVTGFLTIDALIAGDPEIFFAALKQMVLPAVTMALFALAPLTRMTRAAMLEALGAEFIRTARASGLSKRKIVLTYAFRNAMLPLITTMGMTLSYMLGANVLVERVFAWPGIGSFAMDSIINLDYAPLQGFMLMMALIFILINLATDILAGIVDPRASK